MSRACFYLDASGEVGINPEKLELPLVSVEKFETRSRPNYELYHGDINSPMQYDILFPVGLVAEQYGYRITLAIEPPTPVQSVMVQGGVDYIKFIGTGSHASLEYASSKHEPLSLLPGVCKELKSVTLRSKGVCTRIVMICEGVQNLPNIRLIPIFANHRVYMPEPVVQSLGQMLMSSPMDFTIENPEHWCIRVHRIVLVANSDYVRSWMENTAAVKRDFNSVVVHEPHELWSEIVHFMYMRTVKTENFDLLLDILPVASMYLMADMCKLVSHKVEALIRSHEVVPMLVVEARAIANRFDMASLKLECDNYMQIHSSALILNPHCMGRYAEILYTEMHDESEQTSQDPDTDAYTDEM